MGPVSSCVTNSSTRKDVISQRDILSCDVTMSFPNIRNNLHKAEIQWVTGVSKDNLISKRAGLLA